MSKYTPTERQARQAYLAGAECAKHDRPRIPPHMDTGPLYDHWLRGFDHHKFTHQGSVKQ